MLQCDVKLKRYTVPPEISGIGSMFIHHTPGEDAENAMNGMWVSLSFSIAEPRSSHAILNNIILLKKPACWSSKTYWRQYYFIYMLLLATSKASIKKKQYNPTQEPQLLKRFEIGPACKYKEARPGLQAKTWVCQPDHCSSSQPDHWLVFCPQKETAHFRKFAN